MITQARLKELLSYDPYTGLFTRAVGVKGKAAGTVAGTATLNGYISICVDKKKYYAHRLAWLWVHGEMPAGLIDHRSTDKTDNRISNLRLADKSRNARNMRMPKTNTSGIKGVYWDKGMKKWGVQLKVNYKNHRFGYFDDLEDARLCVEKARKEMHGEFARHS